MKILFIGDVFGKQGRRAVSYQLPKWKNEYEPDCIIANVENATHGAGISKEHAHELKQLGIHIMTGGNHSIETKGALDALVDPTLPIIRPANAPQLIPGKGIITIALENEIFVTAINILGQFGMKPIFDSPFDAVERLLAMPETKNSFVIIDWHAEATSEKVAMGYFLDGRVTAVLGTHTHIPTRDEQILPRGTAFITDAGMTGPKNSVIGNQIKTSIERFATHIPIKIEIEESGPAIINAVLIEADIKTHLATSIKHIQSVVE